MIWNSSPESYISIEVKKRLNNKTSKIDNSSIDFQNSHVFLNWNNNKYNQCNDEENFNIKLIGCYLKCDSIVSEECKHAYQRIRSEDECKLVYKA